MVQLFAVPVFFVCFRECMETSIIVAILLSMMKQTLHEKGADAAAHKKLVKQVWVGVGLGLLIVLAIGGGLLGAFYSLSNNIFSNIQDIWEGVFCLLASVIIGIMGAALLRINKIQEKVKAKIIRALDEKTFTSRLPIGKKLKLWIEKNAMLLLPLVTVLREGLEAIAFIGGVGLSYPASAFPIPVITGLLAGAAIGFVIYKGGNQFALKWFLIVATCFLYLVAAGLFSRGIWNLEINTWNKKVGGDAAEVGSGPGSYDIGLSVWHVDCCNPELDGGGGWGIFNALFGWTNSATYGSVIGYNVYWICVIIGFVALRYRETRGHWPLLKKRAKMDSVADGHDSFSSNNIEKHVEVNEVPKSADVEEVR